MARLPRPWRRTDKGRAWYAQVDGRQVKLGGPELTKTDAQKALNKILADDRRMKAGAGALPVRDIANLFLTRCKRDLAPLTYSVYRFRLKTFVDAWGTMDAEAIRPHHVEEWLKARETWGPTMRHGAITAVKRVFNWAHKQGHLRDNALRDVEKPRPSRRERIMTPEQVEAVIAAYAPSNPFRLLLEALRLTGARPGELVKAEARHLDLAAGTLVLPGKTTRATGRLRTIYLPSGAVEILRDLAERNPDGALFRNRDGRPWTRDAIVCRFARLRKRLGMGPEATAYSLRHGFATGALERGVPIATVAELMGHASTAMISRHYSHLSERREHLREAAERATAPADQAK
jgi:integrase